MSGVKCGEIHLEDQIRASIAAIFSQSAATTSALTSAIALAAEVAEAASAAEHFLTAGVGAEHRAPLEAFLARVSRLRRATVELRERQQAMETLRRQEPALTQATLDQVSALGRACDGAAQEIRTLALAVRSDLDEVERVLRIERRGEIYKSNLQTRRLQGLLADIDDRMASTVAGGLRSVHQQAAGLRRDIADRVEAGTGDDAVLETFRAKLEELVGRASALEQGVSEQRAAHHRLMTAFNDAGYKLVAGSENVPDDYRSPARSVQKHTPEENDPHDSEVTARTEVHPGGELRLTMLGPPGAGAQVINCDDTCDERLQRLIRSAAAQGIKIVNVAPVPGGGQSEDETVAEAVKWHTA